MNKFNKAIYFVVVSMLLAACGGGGGSDDGNDKSVNPPAPGRAAGLRECVKDAEGKWTINFTNNIINFADNSIIPVSDVVSLSAFIH